MCYYSDLNAGENIYLEKKDDSVTIHCSPSPAPQSNIYTGFFQLELEPEKNARLAVRISNCIFRVNGKYYKIDDYTIDSYYTERELIYLQLNSNDPSKSIISHEVVFNDADDKDNPQLRHFDDPNYILLYILNIKNYRLRVESYAAGSLIDTVLLPEGFVFALNDGSLASTFTRYWNGDEHEFSSGNCIYIAGFDPTSREGINIKVNNRGGVIWMDKYSKYEWNTTGFASSDNCTVTVTSTSVWI